MHTPTRHTPPRIGPQTHSDALLDAALTYAARGWHVFPLRPGDKRPAFPTHTAATCTGRDPKCRNAGRHQGWEQRATTDPERIASAWSSPTPHGPYGIGIACGPSGLLVVDLDVPKPDQQAPEEWDDTEITCGADVLARLATATGNTVPTTYTVRTGRGGVHLYFTQPAGPGGEGFRNSTGGTRGSLGWLIDTRGFGGYVVAPPSLVSGNAYSVLDRRSPVALPGWIAHRLSPVSPTTRIRGSLTLTCAGDRTRAYVRAAITGETSRVTQALPGQRNHALLVASIALGQLVAGGALPEVTAHAVLLDAAEAHITARAYDRSQAEATIRSGLRRGANNPRRIRDAA